jgi:hypothetical protein
MQPCIKVHVASIIHGVADLKERVDVLLSDAHEQVDAAFARARRNEDHQPFDGQVRREERARGAGAEVHLVELEPQPAVHLQVRAQHRPGRRRSRGELLPVRVGHRPEVHERLDVLAVDAGHGFADHVDHAAVARAQEVLGLELRERPEHHVPEEIHGHRRVGPTPAVHRDPHLRELLRFEPSRRRDLLPRVRQEALERAAPGAHACFQVGDELGREMHGEALDLLHGHDGLELAGAVPAIPFLLELDGPVVEQRRWRAARHGASRAVEEGRRWDGEVLTLARRARPHGKEHAQGLSVGDVVVGDGADHHAATLVAVEPHLKQCCPNVLLL